MFDAGVAIACDMAITTFLVSVVMSIAWKKSFLKVALFALPFTCIELTYLSSLMVKFKEGGFLPLVSAIFFSGVMGIWFWGQKKSHECEIKNQVASEMLTNTVTSLNTYRMRGIGILYSEQPLLMFPRLIATIPCLHSVVVLVSIKATPMSKVALERRYAFRQVEARKFRIFHCTVTHGYSDSITDLNEFESELIHYLTEFIKHSQTQQESIQENEIVGPRVSSDSIQLMEIVELEGVENEIEFIETEWKNGITHMFGEIEIKAISNSSILKRTAVCAFNFLKKNLEYRDDFIPIPSKKILKVGMTLEV
jgi:KUP system potassium uptake protein